MKKRIVSMCCAVVLALGMLIVPEKSVQAEDTKVLDGSYFIH